MSFSSLSSCQWDGQPLLLALLDIAVLFTLRVVSQDERVYIIRKRGYRLNEIGLLLPYCSIKFENKYILRQRQHVVFVCYCIFLTFLKS
jgi:hypothetical protein